MMYRDDCGAALARLAALEVELLWRRGMGVVLRRYRSGLRDEAERLERALAWYQNGERYGWNEVDDREDLSPAAPPTLRLPGVARVAAAYSALDEEAIALRTREVERALALYDWRTSPMRFDVEELRARCAALRAEVVRYAARHPDHPPPRRVEGGKAFALGVAASIGGAWVMAMLLAILAG